MDSFHKIAPIHIWKNLPAGWKVLEKIDWKKWITNVIIYSQPYQLQSILFCCNNVIRRNTCLSIITPPLPCNYPPSCNLKIHKMHQYVSHKEIRRGKLNTMLTCKLMSESTMTGDFPPSSKTTGVKCFAAAAITMRATLPLPKNSRIFWFIRLFIRTEKTVEIL